MFGTQFCIALPTCDYVYLYLVGIIISAILRRFSPLKNAVSEFTKQFTQLDETWHAQKTCFIKSSITSNHNPSASRSPMDLTVSKITGPGQSGRKTSSTFKCCATTQLYLDDAYESPQSWVVGLIFPLQSMCNDSWNEKEHDNESSLSKQKAHQFSFAQRWWIQIQNVSQEHKLLHLLTYYRTVCWPRTVLTYDYLPTYGNPWFNRFPYRFKKRPPFLCYFLPEDVWYRVPQAFQLQDNPM